MRIVIALAALAALVSSAEAQQGRPPGQKPPAKPQQAAPPAPPPIFPCRTAEEVCHLGVVTGSNEVLVLFTNAPQPTGLEKPVKVLSGDSPGAAGSATPLDLGQHMGRVVMLTGAFDREAGLTKAELVEVASPLLSLSIKAQLAGEEPPAQGGKPPPQARPRR
jgi:hypothetical protein